MDKVSTTQRITRLTPLGDVLAAIEKDVVPVKPGQCALAQALGCTLAEDVTTPAAAVARSRAARRDCRRGSRRSPMPALMRRCRSPPSRGASTPAIRCLKRGRRGPAARCRHTSAAIGRWRSPRLRRAKAFCPPAATLRRNDRCAASASACARIDLAVMVAAGVTMRIWIARAARLHSVGGVAQTKRPRSKLRWRFSLQAVVGRWSRGARTTRAMRAVARWC